MKKVTKKSFEKVIDNFKQLVLESDKEEKEQYISDFNDWLDEMHSNDAFGTEGQLDPRGDQRNN